MKSEHSFEVTSGNFHAEVLQSDLPVLVDFTADWCPPCKMIAPLVDALAVKYAGQLRVGTLDSDLYNDLNEAYDVQGLPTLILFQNGKPIHRMIGFRPANVLDAELRQYLQLEKV
jgi:thioredoxin 1